MKPWVDFVLTCMSLIAIPVAGWWAYHNFTVEDTHERNPNISVSADVLPYDDDHRLLVVHIRPKNVGKVPIELNGGKKGDIDVAIKALPSKLSNGYIDFEKLPPQFPILHIVSNFKGGYVLEPGIDYDEVETYVVKNNTTYVVYAEINHFNDEPDDEIDTSIVAIAK